MVQLFVFCVLKFEKYTLYIYIYIYNFICKKFKRYKFQILLGKFSQIFFFLKVICLQSIIDDVVHIEFSEKINKLREIFFRQLFSIKVKIFKW